MKIFRLFIFLSFFMIGFLSCQKNNSKKESKYLRWVGDIEHDPQLDADTFKVCKEYRALQYFAFGENLPYKGEKHESEKIFFEKYNSDNMPDESGLIRIRFIVNCEGNAGRFRLIAMNENYEEKTFAPSITDQLMKITKSLTGWRAMTDKGSPRDYYAYLIFKIKNGELIEIMP